MAITWKQASSKKEKEQPGIKKHSGLVNQMSFFSESVTGDILWGLGEFPLEITFKKYKPTLISLWSCASLWLLTAGVFPSELCLDGHVLLFYYYPTIPKIILLFIVAYSILTGNYLLMHTFEWYYFTTLGIAATFWNYFGGEIFGK